MHGATIKTTATRFGIKNPSSGCIGVKVKQFQDSRHMKVVRLSALCTGRFYPPGSIPGTHIC